MVKKKKQLYTMDDHPVEIYKRGKKKIYVDTITGEPVLHNPIPLIAAAVPSIIKGASDLLGKKKEEKSEDEPRITIHKTEKIDKYTAQERIRDALR